MSEANTRILTPNQRLAAQILAEGDSPHPTAEEVIRTRSHYRDLPFTEATRIAIAKDKLGRTLTGDEMRALKMGASPSDLALANGRERRPPGNPEDPFRTRNLPVVYRSRMQEPQQRNYRGIHRR